MSRKPSLLVIFLTVFIDLVGFGIVLPLLPIFAKSYGANGIEIGLLMASFSLMQFLFAPWWGHLSDKIGRRPILLISTAGAVLSYVMFALATRFEGMTALWLIILSRVFAGICGANITVAQAYIADITPPDQRSKRMGLIGMAFGLGFIFGPYIGSKSLSWIGHSGPGWVAAALCLVNLVLAFFILRESWTPSADHVPNRPGWQQWKTVLSRPTVGLLVTIFFLATFCFTCFELTLGLLISRNFGLDLGSDHDVKIAGETAGTLFMFSGIIGAFVQGGPIGKIVKKLGERKLISYSLFLTAISLAVLPFIHGDIHMNGKLSWAALFSSHGSAWWALLGALAVLAIGSGLTRPPLFGLLSILTPANEQGATIGIAQSAGSLARIAGPMFVGGIFIAHPVLPYLVCAGICLITGIIAVIGLLVRARP
ncbi:MAG TPA: MFS transporter [Candidatus Acidoferrum sp.]|nr:MFS transporter [Candidatus Acidoferrum sp.]